MENKIFCSKVIYLQVVRPGYVALSSSCTPSLLELPSGRLPQFNLAKNRFGKGFFSPDLFQEKLVRQSSLEQVRGGGEDKERAEQGGGERGG